MDHSSCCEEQKIYKCYDGWGTGFAAGKKKKKVLVMLTKGTTLTGGAILGLAIKPCLQTQQPLFTFNMLHASIRQRRLVHYLLLLLLLPSLYLRVLQGCAVAYLHFAEGEGRNATATQDTQTQTDTTHSHTHT